MVAHIVYIGYCVSRSKMAMHAYLGRSSGIENIKVYHLKVEAGR